MSHCHPIGLWHFLYYTSCRQLCLMHIHHCILLFIDIECIAWLTHYSILLIHNHDQETCKSKLASIYSSSSDATCFISLFRSNMTPRASRPVNNKNNTYTTEYIVYYLPHVMWYPAVMQLEHDRSINFISIEHQQHFLQRFF